ncbi:MAG: FtsL-like putative cell division protein [Bacteroidota bacterium]
MKDQNPGSGVQYPEQQEPKAFPTVSDNFRDSWKRWLNYQSIVKQLPFFLFLALLAVLYIYNGHYADKIIRNTNRTAKEVKELQYDYKTVKSEVMFRSKQSELVKAVEPLGLKELTTSPAVLKGENSAP